ncbi:MAG: hypothetical protein U0168_02395 [Nannocystaceae bacterium]
MPSLGGHAWPRDRWGRTLALLVLGGCFDERPAADLDGSEPSGTSIDATESGATTEVATVGTASSTSDSSEPPGACEGDAFAVPMLQDAAIDWAVVHVGEPGAAPAACPAQYVLDRLLFDRVDGNPSCRCACTSPDDVCGVEVTTTPVGCVGVVDLDLSVDGCRNLSEAAEAMAVESTPPARTCEAAAQPHPGPDAVAIAVCRPWVETQTCMPAAPGFTGACFVATSTECPAGTSPLSVEPVAIACDACDACSTTAYCGAHRLALFGQADCIGAPIDDVAVPSPCIPTAAASVQLVAPTSVEPTGCADAAATSEPATVCCASR